EPFFIWLNDLYTRSLASFMKMRWMGFVIIVVAAGLIYLLGANIPTELAPMEDRGEFRLQMQATEGATYEYMDQYVKAITDSINTTWIPEREGTISVTAPGFAGGGVNSGFVRVMLTDAKERDRSPVEISDDLTKRLRTMTGIRSFASLPQTIGDRRGGLPVQFVIQAADIDKLKAVLPEFVSKASANPKFTFVDLDLKFNKPEINISINRDKAR